MISCAANLALQGADGIAVFVFDVVNVRRGNLSQGIRQAVASWGERRCGQRK